MINYKKNAMLADNISETLIAAPKRIFLVGRAKNYENCVARQAVNVSINTQIRLFRSVVVIATTLIGRFDVLFFLFIVLFFVRRKLKTKRTFEQFRPRN